MVPSRIYEIADLPAFLGLSTDSCRRLVRTGKIRAMKPAGRKWFVLEEDLQIFIQEHFNQAVTTSGKFEKVEVEA